MSQVLLSAKDVSVEVDGAVLLPATSVGISPGECVAVRGPNGAGKTTLLRVLAGRARVASGSATFLGAALDERARAVRFGIAALIEPPTLYPDLTLRDQLTLIEAAWSGARSRAQGARGTQSTASVQNAPCAWPGWGTSALSHFDIEALADRFPHELSSGQRQLVSLAVTFARPCQVLLLDEPEQRLDPDRRSLVARALEQASEAGVGVAFASHDAELVARVASSEVWVGGAP